jgi:conjugal transfer pilus assembly protein TraK
VVKHLNRLVMPFDNPVVTTTSQATTSSKGTIVYVATADETPVTLYITLGDNQDIALSLTLIPKRIPALGLQKTLPGFSLREPNHAWISARRVIQPASNV